MKPQHTFSILECVSQCLMVMRSSSKKTMIKKTHHLVGAELGAGTQEEQVRRDSALLWLKSEAGGRKRRDVRRTKPKALSE